MKLFSGKRFFVAIIIIILFISALAFAPHFLTWQSAGMPDFSMNDIRKPEFVEPFKKKTNQVSKVTVHGKLWTSEYDDTGSIYLYDQTPIAQIIHANPFEKITLTDGNTIEIEGIEFLPNRKSSNQMLIDSDGKWSNKNQQDPKSDTLVTQQFLPYQIDDQIKINLKLIHDIKINNIHRIGLFDTKTGWIISESIYKNNRVIHQDGVKINHSDNLVILNYIRPSPSAFFIEIAQGRDL